MTFHICYKCSAWTDNIFGVHFNLQPQLWQWNVACSYISFLRTWPGCYNKI